MLLDAPPPRLSEEKASSPEDDEEGAGLPQSDAELFCVAAVPPALLLLPNNDRMSAVFLLAGPLPVLLNDVVLFEVAGVDRSRSKKPPPLT